MKKVHFPAKYVEMVITRNLKKHKLMKHEEITKDVTRHIEARNLTRNKDIIRKTFSKCTCNNCDYNISYLDRLNKHKKGKHDG